MRFRVVRTHQCGIPLSRRELLQAAGVVGDLLTSETADGGRKGTVTVARLQDDAGGSPMIELIPTLYSPVLVILAPRGLLLSGHERIRERERVVREYVQGWWARPP